MSFDSIPFSFLGSQSGERCLDNWDIHNVDDTTTVTSLCIIIIMIRGLKARR